jgi:two-component system, sensor histidine kinase and response regulator
MDGFEATANIRRMPSPHKDLPIVAVTAHASPSDREMCLKAGMDDYVTKPIILNSLAETVERWIDRSTATAPAVRGERKQEFPTID